jgi:hypothetical protein
VFRPIDGILQSSSGRATLPRLFGGLGRDKGQQTASKQQTANSRKQKVESRKQKAESRKQKAESRKQKAESKEQRAASRVQRAESHMIVSPVAGDSRSKAPIRIRIPPRYPPTQSTVLHFPHPQYYLYIIERARDKKKSPTELVDASGEAGVPGVRSCVARFWRRRAKRSSFPAQA